MLGGIVDAICDRVNLGNKDPSFGAVPRPAAIPSCDERLAGPLEWSTLYCFGLTVRFAGRIVDCRAADKRRSCRIRRSV